MLLDLKLAEINLAVFKVSGMANPLTKKVSFAN